MSAITTRFDGIDCHISRSGYTGEDGFEISCKATRVRAIAERLLVRAEREADRARRARLAAARSRALPLRPRHRHDDVAGRGRARLVDPEAAARGGRLSRRRARAARDRRAARAPLRVGIKPDGRAPAREGTEIRSAEGAPIGKVTSGGFGPTVDGPIAMGYVENELRRARHARSR